MEKRALGISVAEAQKQNDFNETIKNNPDVTEPEPVVVNRQPVIDLKAELAMHRKNLQTQEAHKQVYLEFIDLKTEAQERKTELLNFIKFIDQYRKAFGANVIPLIAGNVSKIVNYLSDGKFSEIVINKDYSIEDFDIYSGSEQDSISFALRLAISQVSKLGTFKTMLLDEVAASFDAEKEARLIEVLKQQPNQLVYITHGL